MKKIDFFSNSNKQRIPFWQPWGFGGCLGRAAFFMFLLLTLLLLISLFRQCDCSEKPTTPPPLDTINDSTIVQPIDGAEEVGMPAPEDNRLPSFDDRPVVPNPENGGVTEIYSNLLYVIFDLETTEQDLLLFGEKFSEKYPSPEHKIVNYNSFTKTMTLEVPADKLNTICDQLPSDIPELDFFVTPVEILEQYATVQPNDPAFSNANQSWYFEPIQMHEAWEISQGSSEIIVGIVDNFMDLSHPELLGDRCIYPYSVTDNNANVAPPTSLTVDSMVAHGTLVTAVAVGNINNGQGSAGIAPKCKFIPVSIGKDLNTITMVEGLLYCMYKGASVINLSCGANFSGVSSTMTIEEQIDFAKNQGLGQEKMWDFVFKMAEKKNATIVWAAGNDNCYSAMDASKRNANTIRVSAVDRNLKKADFSNYGNFTDRNIHESTISAPGVEIWGAIPENSYVAWPGTSFAAPIITGVVALIKSENKDLTTTQIIRILQSTGKPVQGAPEIGKLVQVKDALIKAKQTIESAQIPE